MHCVKLSIFWWKSVDQKGNKNEFETIGFPIKRALFPYTWDGISEENCPKPVCSMYYRHNFQSRQIVNFHNPILKTASNVEILFVGSFFVCNNFYRTKCFVFFLNAQTTCFRQFHMLQWKLNLDTFDVRIANVSFRNVVKDRCWFFSSQFRSFHFVTFFYSSSR